MAQDKVSSARQSFLVTIIRELIFRYDNAHHHKNIKTYPHHKHDFDKVKESPEPDLEEVLLEIAQIHRKTT